ncbi:MAG TPA: hypothetical protein VLA72_05970 [Anaerolineales bacterium]|nr:hypothetical protein [Anaerolineales bacterium]
MPNQETTPIFVGDTPLHQARREVGGEYVSMLGDIFYKISNYDSMPPFFMSIVSSSNHWLFISSTGGLSAGRISAEHSLFPYYTDDKLTENYENTGSKVIILLTRNGRTNLWEPLSERYRGSYHVERNIYKNVTGTVIVFEEVNPNLGAIYRYAWRTSDEFGFVKTIWVENIGETSCGVDLVDGIQNILPANVTSETQNIFSPLLDAYKRAELDPETGLAIFALNSTLTDLAEPSESLLATTATQLGLDKVNYLLSSQQLDQFRNGRSLESETDVRGHRNAYFVHTGFELEPEAKRSWHLIADVDQDSFSIVNLSNRLKSNRSEMIDELERDIELTNSRLVKIVAGADGLQISSNQLCTAHHFANVMFNVMRGGIFADQYNIQKPDFIDFVKTRNPAILKDHESFFSALPAETKVAALLELAEKSGAADLIRLSYSYLPLSFSRRHGDPSRPWNRFAIDVKKPGGSLKIGYEGNWRDIFQNWEALAYSYPEYIESMISTFLNATTADGYNPYRITQNGIDWEVPEPDNPWSNIGYWSDHQIIYLQKIMEISTKVHPGRLQSFMDQSIFSYANVPYRIKSYRDILNDPYNTINFDWEMEEEINSRVSESGSDGRLIFDREGHVFHVNLVEKLLTLLLAKLVNFVPEGGIWMNTQRPEWNDANNALVGKGLSVVTLCYLRRFVTFFIELLEQSSLKIIQVGKETGQLQKKAFQILDRFQESLRGTFSDAQRRSMMDAFGQAGSDHRTNYYSQGVSEETIQISGDELIKFLTLTNRYLEHSLRANKRDDNLYHAYNILHLDNGLASVGHLSEMLEGQVAVLSSGYLSGEDSLVLLKSLRESKLYRPDQHSYILYPDRNPLNFLEKNSLTSKQLQDLPLVTELEKNNDKTLLIKDENGNYHFSGHIRNAKDVTDNLNSLKENPEYTELVNADAKKILTLFEDVFHHSEFTGRSGTFFAYEGLGSIYWHMVSKLLLAVQETIVRTRDEETTKELMGIYSDIREGLSFNKSPDNYGAFPTDPYSHTPKGKGAKQPGMTGMVKEEILTRQSELGYFIENGKIVFDFLLLDKGEFSTKSEQFQYLGVDGEIHTLDLPDGGIVYTICQVPVVLQSSDKESITVHFSDGRRQSVKGYVLDSVTSSHIFRRDSVVHHLEVSVLI